MRSTPVGTSWSRRAFIVALGAIGLGVLPARGGTPPTQDIFRRFAHRVVQVRIVDRSSSSKNGTGSGFFVHQSGYLVTNYHVVSDVHHPGRYRADLVHEDGSTDGAELLNFDVIHDLALMRAERPAPEFFTLASTLPPKGTRLFSMGNPLDLGSSIVEGTFNGLLEDSLYEKIHFTGAINPGMSGGPVFTIGGEVAGVNVSSGGNALGFLVPSKFAARLLEDTTVRGFRPPPRLLDLVRTQMLANQDLYMARLLAEPITSVTLGQYSAPGKLAPFLKCWGDTIRKDDARFETVYQNCWTDDRIWVGRNHSSGDVRFSEWFVTSDKLNRFQFASLYQAYFDAYTEFPGDNEDVTNFRCRTDFVAHAGGSFKVVFCLRGYKKLTGLYDGVLKVASLNRDDAGIITSLALSGVTFENATAFARRFLESLSWKN